MNTSFARKLQVVGAVLLVVAGWVRGQGPTKPVAPSQSGSAAQATTENASSDRAEARSTAQNGAGRDASFIIGNDDVLVIQVWKEPEVSRTLPVRTDGKISLPLAGELQATGRTPLQLEQDITNRLRTYITDPRVTVIVQEINSQKFNILGQVIRPGSYPLTRTTTVVDGIAVAGGFRDFAKQKGIYVLRQDASGHTQRIPFNYKNAIKGKNPEQNIELKPGDTIVVP